MKQKRFHIWFGNKRTSVSVDRILFELMSYRLGSEPDDPGAHRLVRAWLQDKLVSSLGNQGVRNSASQWARIYLIEEVANSQLCTQRNDWIIDSLD